MPNRTDLSATLLFVVWSVTHAFNPTLQTMSKESSTEKDRLWCSLSSETEQMLNQQIAVESASEAHYRAMAAWCDVHGHRGAAALLYHHAEEENEHMMRIFRYVDDAGGHPLQPECHNIRHTFDSLKAVFELALAQEIKVTQSIHRLVDHCLSTKDFATFNFLQWFVAEQVEEEALTRRALELFTIIPQEGIGIYTLDQALEKLKDGVSKKAR